MKNLNTSTELIAVNCIDNQDTAHNDCEIASSTNASDNALSYGGGAGLEVTLTSFEENENNFIGTLSFFINARYLLGVEAEYLKEGDITFSDPEDGPVQTTFNFSESKTDVLQISLGLHFDCGL